MAGHVDASNTLRHFSPLNIAFLPLTSIFLRRASFGSVGGKKEGIPNHFKL
jgi:hypothetical protein